MSSHGGRTVLVYRGAASQLDPHDIPERYFAYARWIHLSSIAGRLSTLEKVFEVAKKSSSLKLSWNPGKAELSLLSEGKLPLSKIKADVLFVNEEEWGQLESLHDRLVTLVSQIVVTNGARGGRVFYQGDWLTYQAEPTQSLDDTGAGDAFAVGYVSALLYGHGVENAVDWGKQNASSVIQAIGATPGLLRKSLISSKSVS